MLKETIAIGLRPTQPIGSSKATRVLTALIRTYQNQPPHLRSIQVDGAGQVVTMCIMWDTSEYREGPRV